MIKQWYSNNKRHIDITVNRISFDNGIDHDDLMSEANMIFLKCSESYERVQKKGITFDTFFSRSLTWGLYRHVRRTRAKEKCISAHASGMKTSTAFDDTDIMLRSVIENMSRDARMCVDIIMDRKEQYEKIETNRVRGGRKILAAYLTKEKGWTHRRVKKAFHEIQEAIL